MCLSLQTVSFKEFSRIVYVFHCSVIKVLICSLSFATACLLYHFQSPLSTTFFQLFISLSCFCCDSVASCDSSYRIPRYSYNVNPKIWLFSKIWLFQKFDFFKIYSSFSTHLPFYIMTNNILHLLYSLPCTAPSINCHIDFFRYTCFHSFPRCVTLR